MTVPLIKGGGVGVNVGVVVLVGVEVFVAVELAVFVAVAVAVFVAVAVAVFVDVDVGAATVKLPFVTLASGSASLKTKPRCSSEFGSV